MIMRGNILPWTAEPLHAQPSDVQSLELWHMPLSTKIYIYIYIIYSYNLIHAILYIWVKSLGSLDWNVLMVLIRFEFRGVYLYFEMSLLLKMPKILQYLIYFELSLDPSYIFSELTFVLFNHIDSFDVFVNFKRKINK